jgi:pimeloyl-ACP methyl ester carboxylesterase
VLANGEAHAVRNIVEAEDMLSFIIPALDASYSATKSGEGWLGDWSENATTLPLALNPGKAPEADARQFATLADGRQIYLDCQGSGAPAVIFDSGAGGDHTRWKGVQQEIAKTTQACTYDRAAFGLSDPAPPPRDTAAVANDIDGMLTAAKIAGPYILVGHSLGSYHVRQFANTRFDKMAGMVLVDPSGDGQAARFATAIPKLPTIINATQDKQKSLGCVEKMRANLVPHSDPLVKDCQWNDADTIEGYLSEVDSMDGASTEQLTESWRSYGDLPLIVLTRGDYVKGMPPEFNDKDRAAMKKVWTDLHLEMTALSTAGEHHVVADSGHYIQADQPQAVITAITDVLTKARARMAPK